MTIEKDINKYLKKKKDKRTVSTITRFDDLDKYEIIFTNGEKMELEGQELIGISR